MFVIDIEASSLNKESYPIEIAWAHIDNVYYCDSFLIIPESYWHNWSNAAEAAHGISRDELFQQGISAKEATERLNRHLANQNVYSDRYGADARWLGVLYNACGYQQAPFYLQAISSLLSPSKVESFWQRLGQSSPPEHRALSDVNNLIKHINYFRHP